MSMHQILGHNIVANDFYQHNTTMDPQVHIKRLQALVAEMESVGRVVVLAYDSETGSYIVTHHQESVNVRPRQR